MPSGKSKKINSVWNWRGHISYWYMRRTRIHLVWPSTFPVRKSTLCCLLMVSSKQCQRHVTFRSPLRRQGYKSTRSSSWLQSRRKSIRNLYQPVGSTEKTMRSQKICMILKHRTKEKEYIVAIGFDTSPEMVSASWEMFPLRMRHSFTLADVLTARTVEYEATTICIEVAVFWALTPRNDVLLSTRFPCFAITHNKERRMREFPKVSGPSR